MKNIKIFQIFYNEATKNSNDPGFLPLDNMENPRPDWREYIFVVHCAMRQNFDS